MKKIIFSCATVASLLISLASCSENNDPKTETTTSETAVTITEKPATEAVKAGDYPSFSDETVNQHLAQFKTLKQVYIKALASKDPAVISNFVTKYTEWARQAAVWGAKLKPEEVPAFNEYMNKSDREWTEATMRAVQ